MRVVSTEKAPAAIGPYSQAIAHGDLVFCSGQVALVPSTGALLVTDDVQVETRQVLDNLSAVLVAAGTDLQHCLKVTVFLKDMNDFGQVNAVYAEYFGAHKPARACVEVARLPKDVRVEIDAIATLSG